MRCCRTWIRYCSLRDRQEPEVIPLDRREEARGSALPEVLYSAELWRGQICIQPRPSESNCMTLRKKHNVLSEPQFHHLLMGMTIIISLKMK